MRSIPRARRRPATDRERVPPARARHTIAGMKDLRDLLIDCRIELRKLSRDFQKTELCDRLDLAIQSVAAGTLAAPAEAPPADTAPQPASEKGQTVSQVALAWQTAARDLKFSDPAIHARLGERVMRLLGAKAGDSIAEAVNPTDYEDHFKNTYQERPYYKSGREWNDYEPAYKYGYDTYGQYRGQRFEDVEPQLERNWTSTRNDSRLEWNEAKGAVKDGWHHIERAMPGDADRDGR